MIFNLINNRIIKPEHFLDELNFCYLNDSGKKIFLKEYDERLRTTIKHKKLRRNVSYQRLIRLECYKLIKHLIIQWIQNSVFEGELSEGKLQEVKVGLSEIIDKNMDSILFFIASSEKWLRKEILGIEKSPISQII